MDFKILSEYDDLCATFFLDDQYLWFDTIKMNERQIRVDTPPETIKHIIFEQVICKRLIRNAVEDLLKLPFFQLYLETKNDKEVYEFVAHVKRYLLMYLPYAGFEISDTTRYGGVEACVISTKQWSPGDEIRTCTGMIACLNPEDDTELKMSNRDFSVMYSQRKASNCLFLGPARFMNHDCGSNTKFISLGPNAITFKVLKKIEVGDELTVFYGAHYFGIDNCECQCGTCEKEGKGYFAKVNQENQSVSYHQTTDSHRRSNRNRKHTSYDEYVLLHGDRRVKLSTCETDELATKKKEQRKKKADGSVLSSLPSPKSVSPSGDSSSSPLISTPTSASGQFPTDLLDDTAQITHPPHISIESSTVNGNCDPRDHSLEEGSLALLRSSPSSDSIIDKISGQVNLEETDTKNMEPKETKVSVVKEEEEEEGEEEQQQPHWLQEMDAFLDDDSDVSSIASDDLRALDESIVDNCIACNRPLFTECRQRYTRLNSYGHSHQYQQLRQYSQNRCWRCSRHIMIYQQEWPDRRTRKLK